MPRFRVKAGIYADKTARPVSLASIDGIDRPDVTDPIWTDAEADKVFYPGDVIDVDKDLDRHNVRTKESGIVSLKFEPLTGPTDDLDSMTVVQLRSLAKAEEIGLPAGLKKVQIVQAIRSQRAYRDAIGDPDDVEPVDSLDAVPA